MPLVRQGPAKICGVEVVSEDRELTELEKVRAEKKKLKLELIDIYNNLHPVWSVPIRNPKPRKVTFHEKMTSVRRYIALPIVSPAITYTPKHTGWQ